MKPLSLTIAGLNSFEEAQTIDFTALTADGLFGLFGPTGSGKSTIIDAMTLALYGEMPRFRKEKRKEWINLNCAEMSVRYLFALGGETYASERRFKRTEDSRAQSDYARLYALRDGEYVLLAQRPAAVNKEIFRLIGLSYEDFTRSVLLPQGRFSEFLLLENRERRLMLERIFHLEAYGEAFNERVRRETTAVRERLAVVDNSVQHYEKDGVLTTEVIAAAADQLAAHRTQLTTRQADLARERERHDQWLQVQADVRKYTEACTREAALLAQEPEITAAEARMAQSERAARVVPYLRARADTAGQWEAQEAAWAAICQQCVSLEAAGEAALSAYEAAAQRKRADYPARLKEAAAYAQALRTADALAEAEKERAALLVDYHEQQARQQQTQVDMTRAEAAERQAETGLQEILDRRGLTAVEPAYRQLMETGVAETRRLEEYRRRLQAAATERENGRKEHDEAARTAAAVKDLRTAAEAACRAAQDEREAARFRHDFAAVAGTLTAGRPCPLCGATTHPAPVPPLDGDAWQRINEHFDAVSDALAQADRADREAGTALRLAEERHNRAESAYAEAETLYKDQSAKWETCVREAGTEDFDGQRRQIAQKDVQRAALEQKEAACRREAAEARARRDTATRILTEAAGALGAIRQQGQEKKAQIDRYKVELRRLLGTEGANDEEDGLPAAALRTTIEARLTQAEQAAVKLSQDEENTGAAYKQAEAARQEARRKKAGLHERGEALRRMLAEQEKALADALTENGFTTPAEAEACLLTDRQREQTRRETGEYRTRLAVAHRDARTLADKLAGADTADIDGRVEHSTAKIRSMEVETDRIKEQITLGQERLAAMESGYAAVQTLKKERTNLTGQYDLLYELSDLLRGNAFVEYMAIGHLNHITADASQRLKRMTAGRYALELDGADFIIRDDHNGGARRSPKTLSGGETFMAALCLALALSANIQLKNNALLEFFFLDEGFGTLDGAALDTVMTALEQLPRERMTVGVITHVEEMKQRIPRHLLVTPPTPGGHGTRVAVH